MELDLRHVSHDYGGVPVLDDISLTVHEGEILCIVGPSGCGKSTLLRLIGGLERPAGGEVLAIGPLPEGCLNPLTFVFQDFALLPWRSAAGNISLALEDHIASRRERKKIIDGVLSRTKLSDYASVLPRNLSGGMKQRVAIARALAVRPAVMLMDEPLSALDAQTRELLIEDFVALWERQPFTSVYVTHNLSEAVRLGHRVAVLSRRPGRIREIVAISGAPGSRRRTDPQLAEVEQHLWQLLRDEAAEADQELVHGG